MIINLAEQMCKHCGLPKPISDYRHFTTKTGKVSVFPVCKPCESKNGSESSRKSFAKRHSKPLLDGSRKTRSQIHGFIYFVLAKDVNRVKIGHTTTNIGKRVRSLQGNSPIELTLIGYMPGTVQDEQDLHAQFKDCRLHFEWFFMTPELTKHIDGLLESNVLKRVNAPVISIPRAA